MSYRLRGLIERHLRFFARAAGLHEAQSNLTARREWPLPGKQLAPSLAGVGRSETADRSFNSKLADVDDRPGPAAIAALAAQVFDSGRLWKGQAVIE